MKRIKVLLIAILAFALTFSVFACSKSSKKSSSEEQSQSITSSIEDSVNSSINDSESDSIESSSLMQGSDSCVSSQIISNTSSQNGSGATSVGQSQQNSQSASTVVSSNSTEQTSSSFDIAVEYSVTILGDTSYGTVTSSVSSGIEGTSVTLTVTAKANCELVSLSVDGSPVTVINNAYTFTLTKDTTVEFSFKQTEYQISVVSATGATVTANVQKAIVGQTVTLSVNYNSGYELDWLKINGENLTITSNSASFEMPANNVEITYACSLVYSITVVSPTNGTVVLSQTTAKEDTTITITSTPASGYLISEIAITYGGSTEKLGDSNQTTFTMPATDVSVEVTFVESDSREYVSHLIFGDSYTHHQYFFRNFYTDMQDLPQPKILGIGGTQIPQWGKTGTTTFQNIHLSSVFSGQGGLDGSITQFGITRAVNVISKYNVQNFVFHIGINDINGGTSASAVISDLKILFSQYHEAYPTANIYWISLSLITCSPSKIDAVKQVNSAMQTYANQTTYLTYINTVDTMFPNGEPVGDWFNGGDGLHFNVDGYNTWSSLILEGLGYPRKDIGTAFGSAGAYYSSNNWTESNGVVSNSFDIPVNNTDISLGDDATTVTPFSEQSLWFKDVLTTDMYAELEVTLNSVAFDDAYPKFGMALKGEGTHMFFFVDAVNGTGTGTSFTERKMKLQSAGYMSSVDWDWTIQKSGKAITGSYTNGNYIKLALLRTGNEMYFIVNDIIVLDLSGREYTSGNMAIGFTTFASNVSIRNYSVTTDISSKLSEFGILSGGSAYFAGAKDSLDITTGGEVSYLLENVSASKFYYEATFKPNSVINSDLYPKFGIVMKASNGTEVLFYVDATAWSYDSTSNSNVYDANAFGNGKNVGFVNRVSGSTWDWNSLNLTYVPSMSYGVSGGTIKMAIYKDGAKIVGIINGVAVVETSRFSDLSGNISVGYMGFNLDIDVTNSKIATSNTLLNVINQNYGLKNDLTIDGDLSDWSTTQKASPYGATATDGTGRGFTVYAFMGTNGIYVGYEMIHSTYINDNIEWFTSTNFEMFAGSSGIQCFASSNGQTLNVVSHTLVTVQNGSMYNTTAELILSYGAIGYTSSDTSASVGFACKTGGESVSGMCEGNAGDWWCGPKHAVSNRSTVAKAGGIS